MADDPRREGGRDPKTTGEPRREESGRTQKGGESGTRTGERQGGSQREQNPMEEQGGSRKETGQQGGTRQANPRTSGTNRDFDKSGESINQGHGHPREERNS